MINRQIINENNPDTFTTLSEVEEGEVTPSRNEISNISIDSDFFNNEHNENINPDNPLIGQQQNYNNNHFIYVDKLWNDTADLSIRIETIYQYLFDETVHASSVIFEVPLNYAPTICIPTFVIRQASAINQARNRIRDFIVNLSDNNRNINYEPTSNLPNPTQPVTHHLCQCTSCRIAINSLIDQRIFNHIHFPPEIHNSANTPSEIPRNSSPNNLINSPEFHTPNNISFDLPSMHAAQSSSTPSITAKDNNKKTVDMDCDNSDEDVAIMKEVIDNEEKEIETNRQRDIGEHAKQLQAIRQQENADLIMLLRDLSHEERMSIGHIFIDNDFSNIRWAIAGKLMVRLLRALNAHRLMEPGDIIANEIYTQVNEEIEKGRIDKIEDNTSTVSAVSSTTASNSNTQVTSAINNNPRRGANNNNFRGRTNNRGNIRGGPMPLFTPNQVRHLSNRHRPVMGPDPIFRPHWIPNFTPANMYQAQFPPPFNMQHTNQYPPQFNQGYFRFYGGNNM